MWKTIVSWMSMNLLILAAACGGGDHEEIDPAEDACEHMIEGPNQAITAASDAAIDAPDIAPTHTRFDIELAQPGELDSGQVDLVIAEAGEHILYLDQDVPITMLGGDGGEIAVEATERNVEACTEVSLGHTFDLEVGTYIVRFGPTDQTQVRAVVIAAGDHDHE